MSSIFQFQPRTDIPVIGFREGEMYIFKFGSNIPSSLYIQSGCQDLRRFSLNETRSELSYLALCSFIVMERWKFGAWYEDAGCAALLSESSLYYHSQNEMMLRLGRIVII